MTTAGIAFLFSAALTAIALAAAAFVLGREALRRFRTRSALQRLGAAERALDEGAKEEVSVLAKRLRGGFDALTIERVMAKLLADDARRALGSALFRELGLVEHHAKRLREARAWAERTDAAKLLGLSACAEAIPALVTALRDPHEDAAVKNAAAEALGAFRDARAVPFLVHELRDVDEGATRPIAEALVRFGEVAAPEFLRLLGDEAHPAGRVWAARVLGHIGAAESVEPLVSLVHARNDDLRIAVAAALGEIGDRRALQPLVQAMLRDPAPQVRAQAAGGVAAIEGERAVDVLVSALGDPDYITRLRALEAFENIRLDDPSPLVRALRDPKNEVRRRAALALERVGYLDRVVDEMASADPRVSRDAYFKLLELGRAGLADGVVSFINHASFQVRALAARAAGDLGAKSAARLLLAAVDDAEWPVRASAAETIGRLQIEGGVAPLVLRLTDPEESVREAAAEAIAAYPATELGLHVAALADAYARGSVPVRLHMIALVARMDTDAAAHLLVRASSDPSDAVRLQAVRAMADVPGAERFAAQLEDRMTDASLEVRTAAVAALGGSATADAFEVLLRALPGATPALRDRIAEALSRGGRPHLLRRLDELSKADDVDVRVGVAWTLGRVGEPAVLPYLVAQLKAPEAAVRASAAGAIAKVDAPGTVEALLSAADDRDPRTRAAVVNALGKRGAGDARVIARLRVRLRDPDAFVRNRAALVLATLAPKEAEAALSEPAIERLVDAPARLVAFAVCGSDAALGRAMDLMASKDALSEAVAFLAHEDAHLRETFFTRLRLPDPAAPPKSLEDPGVVPHYDTVLRTSLDVDSRRVAVEALSRVKSALAIDVLADALRSDPAAAIRQRCAVALSSRVADDRARAALVGAVADPSADVAVVAIRALGASKSRDPRMKAALFAKLGLSDDAVRGAVEDALCEVHREDPMPLLDRIMGVDRPEVLVAGLRVLERLADPATLPLLELLLKSRHEGVRAAALTALARLPQEDRARRAVDAALDDPSQEVRKRAIQVIAASADAVAVRRLERVRIDPSPSLRVELAHWLASTPEEPTHPILLSLVDDAAAVVRAAAFATLLERADARGLGLFLERWRRGLVDLQGEPRAERITSRLSLLLAASTDEEARKAAVAGISAFRAKGYEALVIPALRDPSPDVRIDAVRALAGNDEPKVRASIAELLQDPVGAVREAARRSHLRMIG